MVVRLGVHFTAIGGEASFAHLRHTHSTRLCIRLNPLSLAKYGLTVRWLRYLNKEQPVRMHVHSIICIVYALACASNVFFSDLYHLQRCLRLSRGSRSSAAHKSETRLVLLDSIRCSGIKKQSGRWILNFRIPFS